jgi:hypothetical protein
MLPVCVCVRVRVGRPVVSLRRYRELLDQGQSFWWSLPDCFVSTQENLSFVIMAK